VNKNRSHFLRLGIAVCLVFLPCLLVGETLTKEYSVKVGNITPSQNHQIVIDLPDEYAQKNLYFVKRTISIPVNQVSAVTPKGRISGIKETMTATHYVLDLRYMSGFWTPEVNKHVTVTVTMEIGPKSTNPATPIAPSALTVIDPPSPFTPTFKWSGKGCYAAITVLDAKTGATVWERLVANNSAYALDEGVLKPLTQYQWAVKLTDESGRYSQETQASFIINYKPGTCGKCNGSGHITVHENHNGHHTSHQVTCPTCNGTGKVQVPYIETTKDRSLDESQLEISKHIGTAPGGDTMIVDGQVHLSGWGWIGVYPKTTYVQGYGQVTYHNKRLWVLRGNHWYPIQGDNGDWLDPNAPGDYGDWHPSMDKSQLEISKHIGTAPGGDTMIVNGQVHLPGWGWIGVYPKTTYVQAYGQVTYHNKRLWVLKGNHWFPIEGNNGDWLDPNAPGDYGDWHPSI